MEERKEEGGRERGVEGEKEGREGGRESGEEGEREGGRAEVILQHLPHRAYHAHKAQCGYGLLLSNSMFTIYTGNKYCYQ